MPVRLVLGGYCFGVLATTALPVVNSQLQLAAIFAALAAAVTVYAVRHSKILLRFSLLLFSLCAGLGWHLLWASSILNQRLPALLEGRDLQVTGIVVSLPRQDSIAQQFKFRIQSSSEDFSDRTILLNYYGEDRIAPGQRWQFQVRMNKPHGLANPATFDYEAWLFQQAIAAKGYVRASAVNRLLGVESLTIHALRFRLQQRLLELMSGLRFEGIILALVLGDRSQLQANDWQLFTATGTNHLFVISGLHIGLIAGFCFWVTVRFLRCTPGLALWIPMQKSAALMAILGALLYSLLAGFTLSTQRAFVMILVFMLGYLSNRSTSIGFRYLLALAVVLTLNPLAAMNSGFWFSFLAVAALLLCIDARSQIDLAATHAALGRRIFEYAVKPQLVVFAALLVPLIFWTQQVSLLSPLVNVFAIPLIGMVVVPMCLIALVLSFLAPTLAELLLLLVDAILGMMFDAMRLLLAHVDAWSLLRVTVAYYLSLLLAMLAIVILLLPRGVFNRWLALPLSLPLMLPITGELDDTELRLHVLDVGQGLAVIIQTRDHVLLYDTGANLSAQFNIGSAVIAPVLHDLGIKRLDRIVISHGDNDHAGGLAGLLASMPVGDLISSNPAVTNSMVVLPCEESNSWSWNGIEFLFLHPDAEYRRENNNSCVLQVRAQRYSLLLPGDIESVVERRLVLDYGETLRSTVLIAPHHGSASSSSYALLKMADPDYVVFSSGYRNRFGHPVPQVVTKYLEFDSQQLVTNVAGMISFSFHSDSAIPDLWLFREQNPRYWY